MIQELELGDVPQENMQHTFILDCGSNHKTSFGNRTHAQHDSRLVIVTLGAGACPSILCILQHPYVQYNPYNMEQKERRRVLPLSHEKSVGVQNPNSSLSPCPNMSWQYKFPSKSPFIPDSPNN
jgi:hypothetical protein